MLTELSFPDTINAKIEYVDLGKLIRMHKRVHGICHYYTERLSNFNSQKICELLESDRISREMVKAILNEKFVAYFQGIGNNRACTYAINFPEIPHEIINEKKTNLNLIIHDPCDAPTMYFLGELVKGKWNSPLKSHDMFNIELNKPLRQALTDMLNPFASEKPLYTWYE